jgi:hypothetical protein
MTPRERSRPRAHRRLSGKLPSKRSAQAQAGMLTRFHGRRQPRVSLVRHKERALMKCDAVRAFAADS